MPRRRPSAETAELFTVVRHPERRCASFHQATSWAPTGLQIRAFVDSIATGGRIASNVGTAALGCTSRPENRPGSLPGSE